MSDFQWLQFREHWLLRPDGIVGDTRCSEWSAYLIDDAVVDPQKSPPIEGDDVSPRFDMRSVSAAKALLVILDEIISNATDRLPHGLRNIHFGLENVSGGERIRIKDDGGGFPVRMYEDSGRWIPSIAFSEEKSGSNFDDKKQRSGAGRNGYGATATTVFSKHLHLETADPTEHLHFEQEWSNNLCDIGEPSVRKYTRKKGFTSVTFLPDYERFGMGTEDAETSATVRKLLLSRAYDTAAALSPSKVRVFFDEKQIQMQKWQDYCGLFLTGEEAWAFDKSSVSTTMGDAEWGIRIGVVPVDPSKSGVHAIVNCLRCAKGTHVDWIFRTLQTAINKRPHYCGGSQKATSGGLEPWTIGELKHALFVVAFMEVPNPAYTSATKEELRLSCKDFRIAWTPSDAFIKQIDASGLRAKAEAKVRAKEAAMLQKMGKTPAASSGGGAVGGRKGKSRALIADKYEPATGGRSVRGDKLLIVTEGDSAKTLAVAGLSQVGRERYGIFPLRGKILNPHTKTSKQISDNAEIKAIVQILGLKPGDTSQTTANLSYQKVILFTDADVDGAHICGLFVNMIHCLFPHILESSPTFLQRFATPVVKVWDNRGNRFSFLSLTQKRAWEKSIPEDQRDRWQERYYKGLGTSTSREAREYFRDMDRYVASLEYRPGTSDEAIKAMFAKDCADVRKKMLLDQYDPNTDVDYTKGSVTIEEYVRLEMLHYSWDHNLRNVPHAIDGMKPGSRKVLYTCRQKKIDKVDVKVSELAGIVSAFAGYHHGESSMQGIIVNLAQNHVGVNNLNLLVPQGQHGSRLTSPTEHASARYLFTRLSEIVPYVFHPDDDPVMNYLRDDGKFVEPDYYVPVIPMLLVNGAHGIGTGWSSFVPQYNPRDLIALLKHRLRPGDDSMDGGSGGSGAPDLVPWYEGFTGTVRIKDSQMIARGVFKVDEDLGHLHVTELPPGVWTESFVDRLRKLAQRGNPPLVKDFKNESSESVVDILVECDPEQLSSLIAEEDGIVSKFGLEISKKLGNMHAFAPPPVSGDAGEAGDASSIPQRSHSMPRLFPTAQAIVDCFVPIREACYQKRKDRLLEELNREIVSLANRVRFVGEVVDGTLPVLRQTKTQFVCELEERKYDSKDGSYQYLTSMAILSFTIDLVEQLQNTLKKRREDYEHLAGTSIADLWWEDLVNLETAVEEFYNARMKERSDKFDNDGEDNTAANTNSKKKRVVVRKRRKGTTDSSRKRSKKS